VLDATDALELDSTFGDSSFDFLDINLTHFDFGFKNIRNQFFQISFSEFLDGFRGTISSSPLVVRHYF